MNTVSKALSSLPQNTRSKIQGFLDKTDRKWWPSILLDLHDHGTIQLANSAVRDLGAVQSPPSPMYYYPPSPSLEPSPMYYYSPSTPSLEPSPMYYYSPSAPSPSPSPMYYYPPPPLPPYYYSPSPVSSPVSPSPVSPSPVSPNTSPNTYDVPNITKKCKTGYHRNRPGSTTCVRNTKKKSA